MLSEIEAIRALPRYREHNCDGCGASIPVHSLQMYVECPGCRARQKCRGFAEIGAEIQDTIDAALEWAGFTREEVMQRHKLKKE